MNRHGPSQLDVGSAPYGIVASNLAPDLSRRLLQTP